jgi:hypothetical protein
MAQQWTVSDPRFDKPREQQEEQQPRDQYDLPPRPRSAWKTCLIGCLGVLAVFILLAVIAGFWVGRNWRGWFANFGAEAINQGIDSSDLPPQEKLEVKEQVGRVAKGIRDKQISMEQAGRIVDKLVHSPLMPTLVVVTVGNRYFDRSGLSNDEKTAGQKSLKRFASGIVDHKIDEEGIDAVMKHVANRKPDNSWELRSRVSDAELRAALTEAKAQADAAGVPDDPPEIDPSDEVKRIIDESLNIHSR